MHGNYKFLCTYESPIKNLNSYFIFLRSLESGATQTLDKTGQTTYKCKTAKNVAKFRKITVDKKIEKALDITVVFF